MNYIEFDAFKPFRNILAGMSIRTDDASLENSPYGSGHLGILSAEYRTEAAGNFKKFIEGLPEKPKQIYATEQVHKDHIEIIEADSFKLGYGESLPDTAILSETDGALTNLPGVFIATFYADCTPILLWDPVKQVGGVVHSGWRGTAQKIGFKAVKLMIEKYNSHPKDIVAVIAPSAGDCCYEVDSHVKSHFQNENEFFILPTDPCKIGHYRMNIKGINRKWLLEAGLKAEHIEISPVCTLCDHRFYSFRNENGKTGRMCAFFMIKAE